MKTQPLEDNAQPGLRLLFETAPDACFVTDVDGTFVDGNRAAEELIGCPRQKIIGRKLRDLKLLSARELGKAMARLAQNEKGQATGPDEFTIRRADGREISLEVRANPVQLKGRILVLGLARDISGLRKAEAQLAATAQMSDQLFNLSPDLLCVAGFDGFFRQVNPAWTELLGWSEAELLRRP